MSGTRKKINYLSNKELLKEIAKSKISYCEVVDPKYKRTDLIVNSLSDLTPTKIKLAKKNHLDYLESKKYDELEESGFTKKQIKEYFEKNKLKLKDIKDDDLSIRVLTYEHIPEDILKDKKSMFSKLLFTPFKHYTLKDNKWIEVARSHWSGDFKTGAFTNNRGKPTNRLIQSIMLLVDKFAQRANFRNYSYIDDMKGQALLQLSVVVLQFDEHRSENPNPFSFYTTCIMNSFIKILKTEKKMRTIRDDLISLEGHNASYSYQSDNDDSFSSGAGSFGFDKI